ncbi:hypothetical protein GPROT1_03673 [Gammaproteobacteria bacterium]|nr:hypothetical protein GPROT1_03673 [Gammaproteobacteria bacterium]
MSKPNLSLAQQLAETREQLHLIEERKAEYVQQTDIPLQLIRDERHWGARLAELERGVIDTHDYVAARTQYLAALRDRYGVVQTHAFMELAQDQHVSHAKQLPLLGENGVFVPMRFDKGGAREAMEAEHKRMAEIG